MQMINDQGGINGRRINLISVDDGFTPWRTGNETRKLIEVEARAFIFGSIGTTTQLSVAKYFNGEKFRSCSSRAARTAGAAPRTRPIRLAACAQATGWARGFTSEHILKQDPNTKICILYEDNDYGRDYTAGARDVLGDKYAATVKEATYEFTDASIDRQIVELKATGCNALIAATIPPFAVQAIRKVHDLGWKPMFFMNNVSASVPVILEPAGLESSVGLLSSALWQGPARS